MSVNDETRPWLLVDIDGTLSDISHRLHLIRKPKPDWDAFNKACQSDKVKAEVALLVIEMKAAGYKVAILTGRSDEVSSLTAEWLAWFGIEYDVLFMRKRGDYRSDHVIKKEWYDEHFKDKKVLFVLEDRDRVVEMWREQGLTCLQVQKGDY